MTRVSDQIWDVVVVGAGPAGATAARVAAEHGASVLLVDRASFPRYKTCGGGLLGSSIELLPASVLATSERTVDGIGLSYRIGRVHRRPSKKPILKMVQRETFDQANVDAAKLSGVTFVDSINVRGIDDSDPELVRLATGDGTLTGRVVIGADGAGGRVGRYVGARMGGVDLGLEAEIPTPPGRDFSDVRLDWGPRAGTYAWVFPKAHALTVGVIERKGHSADTKAYLDAWLASLNLDVSTSIRASGHLTQWREPGSPLRRGNTILAGETAGLLEPWTREGISFALRSGAWAGESAANSARGDYAALDSYVDRVERELEPEIAAGRLFLQLFEKHPGLIHRASAYTALGSRFLFRFCRGETNLARVLRHRAVARTVKALSR